MKKLIVPMSFLVASMLMVACGPPPKPAELSELETMRNDSYTGQISQTSPDMLDKSDKFYKMAKTAWQDSDLERAKEYAWLGQLRYRTAEAQTRKKEEETRKADLVGQLQQTSNSIEVARVKKEGLEKNIASLKGTADALATNAAMSEQKLVQEAILAAEGAREKAKGVNAGEFAAGSFNMAENILKMAQEHLAGGRLADATKNANEAKTAFDTAYTEAKPEFDKTQTSRMNAERQQSLLTEAAKISSAEATQDARGVVIAFPGSFERKKTSILGGYKSGLDLVAELANKYPETTVMVEGYTQSKGSDSKNLTISQTRADTVRDYLIGKGVDAKRMVTTGYGEEKPRYDNKSRDERGKNDRVEFVFVFTK